MILHKFKSFSLLEWLLFGVIFSHNCPWIIWGYGLRADVMYSCTLLAFFLLVNGKRIKGSKNIIVTSVLIFYFFIYQCFYTVSLSYFFIAIAFLISSVLTKVEGEKIIKLSTYYLFLSVIIPLPLWLIHQFVSPFPVYNYIDVSSWKTTTGNPIVENHLLFVTIDGLEKMRFYSWYDEPGVLGTFSAFILWANKFHFKDWKIITILVGSIFTFSMAFFTLSLLGWLYHSTASFKRMISTICVLAILSYGTYYLLEDNLAFQESVIGRIENIDEAGVESRGGVVMDSIWDKASNYSLLFGFGNSYLSKHGEGLSKSYKAFIIEYGYIGLTIVLLSYIVLIKKMSVPAVFTLLLFFLSFLQRPHLYTAYMYLLFSCIVLNYSRKTLYIGPNTI